MMLEGGGGNDSSDNPDDGFEQSGGGETKRGSEQISWPPFLRNAHNRALIKVSIELGGSIANIVDVLKAHGEELTPEERDRFGRETFKSYLKRSRHGNFQAFVSNMTKEKLSETERAALYDTVYKNFQEHNPSMLWRRDRKLRALCAYLLDEDRASPITVSGILKEKKGLDFAWNYLEDFISKKVMKGIRSRNKAILQEELRPAAIRQVVQELLQNPPLLTEEEINEGKREGAALINDEEPPPPVEAPKTLPVQAPASVENINFEDRLRAERQTLVSEIMERKNLAEGAAATIVYSYINNDWAKKIQKNIPRRDITTRAHIRFW